MSIRIQARELGLIAVVLVIVLVVGTFLLLKPMVQRNRALQADLQARQKELGEAVALVDRLADLRRENDVHEARLRTGNESTAELIAKLNRLAQTAGVNLTNTKPSEPKQVEFYRELKVEIWFEGDISPVVRFLYSLMSDSGVLDLRQLTVNPKPGSDTELRCNADIVSIYLPEQARERRDPSLST